MAAIQMQPPRRGHGEQRRAATALPAANAEQAVNDLKMKARFFINRPPPDQRRAGTPVHESPTPAVPRAPPTTGIATLSKSAIPGWWNSAYLIDWATGAVMLTVYLLLAALVSPRQSVPTTAQNALPYHDNTFPLWAVNLLCVVGPFVMIILVEVLGCGGAAAAFEVQEVHHAALGLFGAYTLTSLVAKVVALLSGTPRPSWANHPHQNAGGRESFPAFQSSTAWMGWVFFVLFVRSKLGSAARSGVLTTSFPSLLLMNVAPLVVPTVVSVCNFVDNQNSWADIVAGVMLGAAAAFMMFASLFRPDGDPKRTARQ